MKRVQLIIGVVASLVATGAAAQTVDLTGTYQCVQSCRGGMFAHITQNGPELNLVTEAGVASRAWPDWFYPGSRIWIDAYNMSAVYTPDGFTIQFDNGTIWQRELPPPPPPPRRAR
ncbi:MULTISPECIES: hypothetical protein [Bradyrhizobium]|uniref:hypothetical protein n=1 Tax=Bradyrhizobium TaxID=374 RepID=UPI00067EB86F|nr:MULTISPECIES: hypothetical protein [Bradyrhizobium]PAY07689.1 hypothetical protein CK489_18400 [Bradyrhizobium sp. UFLA03-84]